MIKAILLVLDPARAWENVAFANRSISRILMMFLLPLLVLTSFVEAYGLVHWGETQSGVKHIKLFTPAHAAVYEAGQLLLTLLIVLIGARIVKAMGETFHGRNTYTQGFTVVAYGLSPLFALRVLDALAINVWIAWAAGILLCISTLYHGVPRIMRPDPPQAFGLYLMSALMLTLITGLARFLTAWYLAGKFQALEAAVENFAAQLSR